MNIDWSKAPEGFQVWVQDLRPEVGTDLSGWHKELSDRYLDQEGSHWLKENEGKWFTVHRCSQYWSGEGIPPIGTVCEWLQGSSHQWERIQILAYHGREAWIQQEDASTTIVGNIGNLRPLRTPEQIAAEEREREIEELVEFLRSVPWDTARLVAQHLHDAGYRKTEGGAA